MIREEITAVIASQKAYSLIFDGTTDISKKEACSVTVRYTDQSELYGPIIRERLFDVFTTGDTSADNLEKIMVESLENGNLDFAWLMSQSYDGASNMRGATRGLQARILSRAPKAMYTWCYAHRLNLVIEGMIASCTPIRNIIGILEELYIFFGGHKRHDVFIDSQKDYAHKKTLKRTGNSTRTWRSVEDATDVVLTRFQELCTFLQVLSVNFDASTMTGAQGLLRQLDMKMIIYLHIIDDILSITGPCSRVFQAISTDLAVAVNTITSCKSSLLQKRSDRNHFDNILKKAKEFAKVHNINAAIIQQPKRKIRKRYADGSLESPIHPESQDSSQQKADAEQQMVLEEEDNIYRNVYVPALDFVLLDLTCRFDDNILPMITQMMTFSAGSLLHGTQVVKEDINIFCEKYQFEVETVVQELNNFIPIFQSSNVLINMEDLVTRIKQADVTVDAVATTDSSSILWTRQTFLQPYRLLHLISSFSTLMMVYKTLVTIAITSASAERAMSKVKLIKTRLRSNMSDEYFCSLMLIPSEKDLADRLPVDKLITRFASLSPVLKKHLMH